MQSSNSWSTTSIDKFTASQLQNQLYLKQLMFFDDTSNDIKQNLPTPGPYVGLDRGTKVPNPNINIWLIVSPTITTTIQKYLIQSLLSSSTLWIKVLHQIKWNYANVPINFSREHGLKHLDARLVFTSLLHSLWYYQIKSGKKKEKKKKNVDNISAYRTERLPCGLIFVNIMLIFNPIIFTLSNQMKEKGISSAIDNFWKSRFVVTNNLFWNFNAYNPVVLPWTTYYL